MPSEPSARTVRRHPTESSVAPGLPEAHRCPVWATVKAGRPVSDGFTVAAR